jgi:hypothetical protein
MSRITEAEIAEIIEAYLKEKTSGQASIKELVREIPKRVTLSAPAHGRVGVLGWCLPNSVGGVTRVMFREVSGRLIPIRSDVEKGPEVGRGRLSRNPMFLTRCITSFREHSSRDGEAVCASLAHPKGR